MISISIITQQQENSRQGTEDSDQFLPVSSMPQSTPCTFSVSQQLIAIANIVKDLIEPGHLNINGLYYGVLRTFEFKSYSFEFFQWIYSSIIQLAQFG